MERKSEKSKQACSSIRDFRVSTLNIVLVVQQKASSSVVCSTGPSLKGVHICIGGISHTLILFYKQRFISNTKYEKTSWTVAFKTE